MMVFNNHEDRVDRARGGTSDARRILAPNPEMLKKGRPNVSI